MLIAVVTKAVLAALTELSPSATVGTVTIPVKLGFASGAFKFNSSDIAFSVNKALSETAVEIDVFITSCSKFETFKPEIVLSEELMVLFFNV